MSPVARRALLCILICLASPLFAQSTDPLFSQVQFEKWFSGKTEPHIRWAAHVNPPTLSTHQRLIASVNVEVDGAEIAKWRGRGHLVVLVELRDSKGRAWQNHQEFSLAHIEEGIKANNVDFSQLMFVLPGEYKIFIAVYDDATGEHNTVRRQLHVPQLKNDPLPDAWDGLPAVEFLPDAEPPESWYLPTIQGRLKVAVSTHEPVHIELLVNLTPPGLMAASTNAQTRVFEILIPAAKVLSQIDWGTAPFGIKLLDLPKQHVVYQQDDARSVDWALAADSLSEVNAGTIDARTLEKRHLSADFFVREVRREITKSRRKGVTPVVIVLSGAIQFDEAQEVVPIRPDNSTTPKIFYIRYQPVRQLVMVRGAAGRRPVRMGDPLPDRLEPLLKPLEPRLFEVTTQEQVRRALAAILAEISKL